MFAAGLIFDDSIHYLDHLAPFCALMDWPLIIVDPIVAESCQKFYPMTRVIHTDFSYLPSHIVSCNTRASIELWLGPFSNWRGKTLWLPHGQSDKGWKAPFFEALGEEDLLLIYGERMKQVLEAKGIRVPQITVGNFRWQFTQTHQSFYDELMDQSFGEEGFILYAPTWQDSEQNSSYPNALEALLEHKPTQDRLLIKPHPNTIKASPARLEHLRGKVERQTNVGLIDDFLPIYPLLRRTKTYIGDMSSIGYDYLRFGKPMFFLCLEKTPLNPSSYLMQAGTQIVYEEIPTLFSRKGAEVDNRELLNLAFDATNFEMTRTRIEQWVGQQ